MKVTKKFCSAGKRYLASLAKGIATRSENSTEIVSMTIVAITFADDLVQGGHVELFRLVSLNGFRLIGHFKLF